MTIASAIQNAQEKVRNAYTAVSEKGGTVPTEQNLNNLPEAINSISGGGGDIVNTTAMSGAESFTGGEKVILNPTESTVAGPMTVTGGEFSNGRPLYNLGRSGGFIRSNTIQGFFFGGTDTFTKYTGSILGDTITIESMQGISSSQRSPSLPPLSEDTVGVIQTIDYQAQLVELNTEGQLNTIHSYGAVTDYSAEGDVFLLGDSAYPWGVHACVMNKDHTYSLITGTGDIRNRCLFQVGDDYYFYFTATQLQTFNKDSTAFSTLSVSGSNYSLKAPLDKEGNIIAADPSSHVCYLQHFSKSQSTFSNITRLPDIYDYKSIVVLPTSSKRSIADIYIIPNEIPAKVVHYVWDGMNLSNRGTVLSSEDLGEYVYPGGDLKIDGNTGILWGTFYKTNATSGVDGRIFAVQTQGRTVITQFKAEPADKAVFDPSKSLTGFVDSNLGKDAMGNTELAVKTALDPNEAPWSDIGKVFGLDVKITKGEY